MHFSSSNSEVQACAIRWFFLPTLHNLHHISPFDFSQFYVFIEVEGANGQSRASWEQLWSFMQPTAHSRVYRLLNLELRLSMVGLAPQIGPFRLTHVGPVFSPLKVYCCFACTSKISQSRRGPERRICGAERGSHTRTWKPYWSNSTRLSCWNSSHTVPNVRLVEICHCRGIFDYFATGDTELIICNYHNLS